MLKFRFPKPDRKCLDGETPLQKIVRLLVLLVLFGVVVLGFWLNHERRMESFRKPASGSERSGVPQPARFFVEPGREESVCRNQVTPFAEWPIRAARRGCVRFLPTL